VGWDAGEDGALSTQDVVEGGAPIRVHGEMLVVLSMRKLAAQWRARGRSRRNIGGSQGKEGMGRDKQDESDSLGANFWKNYNLRGLFANMHGDRYSTKVSHQFRT
jgi:hypothetical protein